MLKSRKIITFLSPRSFRFVHHSAATSYQVMTNAWKLGLICQKNISRLEITVIILFALLRYRVSHGAGSTFTSTVETQIICI